MSAGTYSGAPGTAVPRGPVVASAEPGAPVASPSVLRVVAFTGLAAFCAVHWSGLVAPADRGRLLVMVAIAVALGLVATAAGRRLSGLLGAAAVVVLALVAFAGVLLAAGVDRALLAPDAWGSLAGGIGQGLQALPGITVPYLGVDRWVVVVIDAGGGLLLLVAALLAARSAHTGRRPLGAAVVLSVVYAVAIVEHTPPHAFLGGAAFTVLLGALLWAERVERPYAFAALAFVVVSAAGGLALAPALDGRTPWLDYERIAEALTSPPSTAFDWNHAYGPLDWPREGREVLRVEARTPAYWKAADLDDFDGLRWRTGGVPASGRLDTQMSSRHPEWRENVTVDVRNLRSAQYVAPGITLAVRDSPRIFLPATPGTYVTGSERLRRGDSYVATVYAPHPSGGEMASAGTAYPSFADAYLSMGLPASSGGGEVRFATFGHATAPRAALEGSPYAGVYALARRLRRSAPTPYAYVKAVEDHLAGPGFRYSEDPADGPVPLADFLLRTKAGYCQHFAGAMALLLRMGGVPARVASGFTAGTYDSRRREWVARDLDAHSWVEAYFPSYGWVTFDPTPQAAPPRGQLAAAPTRGTAAADAQDRPPSRSPVPDRRNAPAPSLRDGGGTPVVLLAVVVAALLALAGAVFLVLRGLRRMPAGVAPELAELDRALRRTGRPAAPPLTLSALEQGFARHSPDAAAYVAAVRAARFGGASEGPTELQRAALRRELASGLGRLGKVRAWWAVPPARLLHFRG